MIRNRAPNSGRILALTVGFFAAELVFIHPLWAETADEATQPLAYSSESDASSAYDLDTTEALYLLVSINGRNSDLVIEVKLSQQSNRMSALRDALESIGIAAPRTLGKTVFFDQIPGLSYIYEMPTQTLLLTVNAAALIPVEISAAPRRDLPQTQTGFGLILNYRLTADLGDNVFKDGFKPTDAFAGLELRAYTPLGVLVNTGSISTATNASRNATLRRYDTYFRTTSPSRMTTTTIGDFTTSGLTWARPVRLGGLQIRRDFSLRDDVVTKPLLSYSGTAAVPSTIDVYVDNVRAYSGAIPAGRFNLSDVPMITSGGDAVFVLRDAGGNDRVTTVPFFATQNLLAKGTLDYSLNVGRVRQMYSLGEPGYGDSTAGVVNLRYGVSDRLTVEAHAEAMDDMKMVGLGFGTTLFNSAEVTLAAGTSVNGTATGSFVFGTLRTKLGGVKINASTWRVFGDYQDIASLMSPNNQGISQGDIKALDALSLTFPIFGNEDNAVLTLVHSKRSDMSNTIFSASYFKQLRRSPVSVRVNAFKDFTGDGGYGMSIDLSLALGPSTYASTGLRRDRSGDIGAVASLSRSANRTTGSYGYHISMSERSREFRATDQSRYGRGTVALRDSGHGASATATFDGALVIAGGGLFASNRVSDAFAIVNLGAPSVPVMLNNRVVARTGILGRAMVPDLRSYRSNRISIDPLDLPLNSNPVATAQDVVPAWGSGVTIDFQVSTNAAAIVVLRDAASLFFEPGTIVRLQGNSAEFIVGYDGEVWIDNLSARNQITVETASGTCAAEFTYAKTESAQAYIDGVECR
jgi:outer membrane usher protein